MFYIRTKTMVMSRWAWGRDFEQLGEEPGQGFKTLVCVTPSNDYVVCCIPVADELDLKSAARAAGEKSWP